MNIFIWIQAVVMFVAMLILWFMGGLFYLGTLDKVIISLFVVLLCLVGIFSPLGVPGLKIEEPKK